VSAGGGVLLSWEAPKLLTRDWGALVFGSFAGAHLRPIAFDEGARVLLKAGNVGKDAGVVPAADTKAFIPAEKTRQWAREPKVRMLA
ncbi:catalase HPII, partial [Xanthomonas perforans]